MEYKQVYIINYVKTLAILLIINSHCDKLYPISNLGFGGAFGNGLFFIVMGYLVAKSKRTIKETIKNKFIRLYPETWVLSLITILLFPKIECNNLSAFISIFIFPTLYWFCGAAFIFYVLYSIVQKFRVRYSVLYITLFLSYAIFYLSLDTSSFIVEGESYFKWIYYFVLLLIGTQIKQNENKLIALPIPKMIWFLVSILSFIFLIIIKLSSAYYSFLYKIQFVQQLLIIIYSVSLLLFALHMENYIKEHNILNTLASYISKRTWEIYLVQGLLLRYDFKSLFFPNNMIVAVLSIIILSEFLYRINSYLRIKSKESLSKY